MIRPKKKGDLWIVDTGRHLPRRIIRQFSTPEQAAAFIAQLGGQYAEKPRSSGVRVSNDRRKQADPQSCDEAINAYLRWAEKIKRKSPNTMRSDISRLTVFRRWLADNAITRACDITDNHMRQFQEYYFSAGPFAVRPNWKKRPGPPTPQTWEKYRQIISAFCHWCRKRGMMSSNPIADPEFRIRMQQKIPDIFTVDELGKLFAALDQADGPAPVPTGTAFRLLAYTGMRLGEMIELKWKDVDIKTDVIRITRSKSGRVRSIPIHPELKPRLEALPTRSCLYVLDSGDGQPLYSSAWWWKTWRAASVAAGVRPRPIHNLRHTFAANLAMANVPLPTIQKLLGHESAEMTQRIYIHFYDIHLQEAIKTLPY